MPTRLTSRAKVHFSGVAGKGIAPAASLALQSGYEVTGDDLVDNHRTELLRAHGATIVAGSNQIPDQADAVVASTTVELPRPAGTAPGPTAPGRQPIRLQRLEFVQHVFERFGKDQVAVIGSVGKSSAAAITTAVFAPTTPSCYIGADVDDTLCGARLGTGPWAITEACEYQDAYLALSPKIAMILNIAPNHEDHFGPGTEGFAVSLRVFLTEVVESLDHIVISASAAAELAKYTLGTAFLKHHGSGVSTQVIGSPGEAYWQFSVENATPEVTRFALSHTGATTGRDVFEVPLAGNHAATAAAMAVVAARCAGMSDSDIRAGLATARLPQRRMTRVHSEPGLSVYDDNARLPVQLESLLEALRQRHPRQLITAVISPWGRRNRRDLQSWATAAAQADFVYILPVAGASTLCGGAEHPAAAVDLVDLIHAQGGSAQAVSNPDEIVAPALSSAAPQVYVTAGYDSSHHVFVQIHRRLQTTASRQCPPQHHAGSR
ncbi:UDP-N-acetylmuramate--alanine ligase [Kribbella aluminosa]|uniref:UDP-N-acetylmuramate--alanine ligase n=1 Tax=Kribbella aluminosa TaxID=416017 RepID=A0ABS4UNR4_9ACTN|nr:Mur ligase domain-containing protein [Kribbella aluminosa]MBP2353292.1 UDP-N-acetylmuramate--alanine ligase [Kribbella aluminosa]